MSKLWSFKVTNPATDESPLVFKFTNESKMRDVVRDLQAHGYNITEYLDFPVSCNMPADEVLDGCRAFLGTPITVIRRSTHDGDTREESLILTGHLLDKIARFNGSERDRVRDWLMSGQVVFTNFSTYRKA